MGVRDGMEGDESVVACKRSSQESRDKRWDLRETRGRGTEQLGRLEDMEVEDLVSNSNPDMRDVVGRGLATEHSKGKIPNWEVAIGRHFNERSHRCC